LFNKEWKEVEESCEVFRQLLLTTESRKNHLMSPKEPSKARYSLNATTLDKSEYHTSIANRVLMPYKIALLCTFSTVPRTLRMARLLVDAGYSVHIIEWDRTGLKPRIETKNGIVFKRLKLAADFGLSTFYLMPIWLSFAFIHLFTGNYDLVQPQNLDCLVPASISVRLIRHGHIIYDLADFYKDAYVSNIPIVRTLFAILEKLLIRKTEALILTSERQISQVEAKNLPQNLILFYNMPLPFVVQSIDDETINKNSGALFSLFYAGALAFDRVNLLMNLINAVHDLPAKLVVAGFGEYQDLLQHLSKNNRQLVFLGRLNHGEIMKLTKKADLIVLPYDPHYICNKVGLPNKLFEAMSCGVSVLASCSTYMGEIVKKERIGVLVDYSNAKQLRFVIKSLIRERNNLQLFGKNARKLYAEKFEPRKMCTRYIRLVEKIISK
jgi:glycosyltransferase involved in cell wall biosynthesis